MQSCLLCFNVSLQRHCLLAEHVMHCKAHYMHAVPCHWVHTALYGLHSYINACSEKWDTFKTLAFTGDPNALTGHKLREHHCFLYRQFASCLKATWHPVMPCVGVSIQSVFKVCNAGRDAQRASVIFRSRL